MDERNIVDTTARLILDEANSAPVGLWAIGWELREHQGISSEMERRRYTLEVVKYLLARGVEIADYHEDRGWTTWKGIDSESVLDRIRREWDCLGHEPNLGDICWFRGPEKRPSDAPESDGA